MTGSKEPPTFSDLPENSFIAYSYIEANVKFPRPYCQNTEPFGFRDGQGKTNQISSFGIRRQDSDAQFKLRAQPYVLSRDGDEMMREDMEFAIDLCGKSSPSQIVVARIAKQKSLSAALARVDEGIAKLEQEAKRYSSPKRAHELRPTDVLLVPDICWLISHHFSELEGKKLMNQGLGGMPLIAAQQDILFRLNRYGVDLKSESSVASAGRPIDYVLDRPFLIYMKKRGAQMPYFVMWVDNAELLSPWQGPENQSSNER